MINISLSQSVSYAASLCRKANNQLRRQLKTGKWMKLCILELFVNNKTKVMQMPFIKSPKLTTCKGVGLHCAHNIFNKMSKDDYKKVC